jgi:hypothetical protein
VLTIASVCALLVGSQYGMAGWPVDARPVPETPPLPRISAPLPETADSYAFSASAHQQQPLELQRFGYLESTS